MRHSAIVSIALALFATTAGAAPASKLTCAIVDVFDCSSNECTEVTAEAVGVPVLLRVDTAGKSMTALDLELAGKTTKLDSVSKEEHKTTARAHEEDRNLVLAIEDASGDAILTVSDNKMVLVGYGECSSR